MMRVLRLSLKSNTQEPTLIICICRGKSDREISRAIDSGATSVRDLQRCGVGDQCGSCHNSLRALLATAATASSCPACLPAATPAAAHAHA
jgi:bacterioferritin-associated ferredoxin